MKNRLFWRLFAAFIAALLLTVTVFSFFMITLVRAERQSALENELTLQAQDIALLLSQQDVSAFSRFNRAPVISQGAIAKILDIRETYGCIVWLVYASGEAYTIGEDEYDLSSEQLTSDNMLSLLMRTLGGEEIVTRGVYQNDMSYVTIGVPWFSGLNRVQGAVMLHLSIANMAIDYSDMLRNALISAAIALIMGTAMSLLIASSQSKSIRMISDAVSEFAGGKLDSRVHIRQKGEIQDLGEAFNHMADEIGHLEQSRRDFVASVSHELRSPLTCIRGYIEGIQDGTIEYAEQGKYLDVALQETDRLSMLVNDLLDLSRIESGKVPFNKSVIDINELVRLTILKFETKIDKKNLDVEVNLRDDPLYVNADPSRIAQVLTNLIDNAIKFLPKGGLLTLSAYLNGKQCCVSVKDNGPGIASSDLPYIFDRFYKADKAHTAGMGTGLGLSIVSKILEQHGQTIKVNSSTAGTEFIFTLEYVETKPKGIDTHESI